MSKLDQFEKALDGFVWLAAFLVGASLLISYSADVHDPILRRQLIKGFGLVMGLWLLKLHGVKLLRQRPAPFEPLSVVIDFAPAEAPSADDVRFTDAPHQLSPHSVAILQRAAEQHHMLRSGPSSIDLYWFGTLRCACRSNREIAEFGRDTGLAA
jgi:hypothetical protein